MDRKIKEYRQKHKKCKYCKYRKLDLSGGKLSIPPFYVCEVKDKIIRDMLPDMTRVPRLFCKWYEVKEDNENI